MSKKWYVLFFSMVCLLAISISSEVVYADNSFIKYEDDGRVKPIKEADLLTESQLDEAVDAIGIDTYVISDMSKEEKVKIASEGGLIVETTPVSTKTFYRSLDGTKIEYTQDNEDLIYQKKLDDLKKYNELTGESLKINDIQPETPNQGGIQAKSILPNNGFGSTTNGKLNLNLQVRYLGSNSTQYRYEYIGHAIWGNPLNDKTDILGMAWSEDAVAVANTFSGSWYQEQLIADGNGGIDYIFDEKNLTMSDPKSYGHYVKVNLGGADYQTITTSREVRVAKRKAGDPGYVIAKYHHTYYAIPGISASIGPISVDIPNNWLNAGDETYIEYSFTYGDVNTWS